MSDFAIWWTSQAECEAIGAAPAMWPKYLREEWRSRCGRPGRGRLWFATELATELAASCPTIPDACWDSPLGRFLEQSSGGIVILARDADLLAKYPGTVTDLELRAMRGSPA